MALDAMACSTTNMRRGTVLHLQLDHLGGDLTILQVTDTHIGAAADSHLAGVDTRQSLTHVLRAAANTGSGDLMLLTGDLSDDGSVAAYRELQRQVEATGVPHAWLPGNHDHVANMEIVAAPHMATTIGAGRWGIILLNSQIPGAVGGELAATELERLRHFLQHPGYQHLLVCVHHHPLSIGSRWLDEQTITNGDQLLQMLDGCERVKALLWGHVHQEFDLQRGHYRLLATPSTCVQFAPASQRFKVDHQQPGYRRLWLGEDGSLRTEVGRIAAQLFDADYECSGY